MNDKYNDQIEMFYKNVKYFRKHKNISIGDIERNAGVSVGYLSRRSKAGNVSLQVALEFSDAIGESINDLCTKDFQLENYASELKAEIEKLKKELEKVQ